jgi:hypothetical protein
LTKVSPNHEKVSANDEDHRRIRRLQSHMFSEKALSGQEPLINSYVNKLIIRLHEETSNLETSVVDMVKWYKYVNSFSWNFSSPLTMQTLIDPTSYTTFDVLGDLAFGESFGCLDSDVLHPWIINIFKSIKGGAFMVGLKQFVGPLSQIFYKLTPRDTQHAQDEHLEFSARKARQRMMQGGTDREDFMSYILKHNDEKGYVQPSI